MCIALDTPDLDRARALVREVGDAAGLVKIGMEFFYAHGAVGYDAIAAEGAPIFLDLKLHDIPNTVRGAVEAAADEGVELLTVHAAGGPAMLEAAAKAAEAAGAAGAAGSAGATGVAGAPGVAGAAGPPGGGLRLLGVTILTSLSASDLGAVWGRDVPSVRDEVVRLAALGREAGLDGVVASALEAEVLKRQHGQGFLVATPGIRLSGEPAHDQARVATPAEAVAAGADYLVVGRSVTAADDPASALERMREEAALDVEVVGEERP